MKKRFKKDTGGFTLLEVILSVALIGLIITLSSNILIFGSSAHRITVKEYSIQSDLRRAAEQANKVIRYSKAVFAVPETFISPQTAMDPGWTYLMVSPDEKRIVIMEYDESLDKHVEKVVVGESEGILYGLSFDKDESANGDTIIKYRFHAYNTDDEGNKINERVFYETTVETVNAIQVVDKGTEYAPSIALAFRGDGQTSGKGKNQIAYITIVVDISNSMNQTPSGGGSTTSETSSSRLSRVRNALIGDSTSSGKGIIQEFSKEENVFISLVPFANTANYPSPHANTNPNGQHPIYEVYNETDSTQLLSTINNLKADGHKTNLYGSGKGGTNTGDGLRRAYHLHNNFRTRMAEMGSPIDEKDQVHHYMILLVDGETTFETANYNFVDNGFYTYSGNIEWIGSTRYYRYNWRTSWSSSKVSDYLLDGNLDLATNYNPPSDSITYNREYYGTIYYKVDRWWGWYEESRTDYIVEYGKQNDSFNRPLITGNGSSVINNSSYVSSIGNLIKDFEDSSGIRSYLIGYASGLTNNINYIGDKIGTEPSFRFTYNSSDFNIDEVFKNIATDIMADFWLAAGPQIVK